MRVKTLTSPLEGSTKNPLKLQNLRGGKKFTSEIKHPSDVSKLIKSFNNSKNNALGLLKNKDGEFSDNPEESLNTLLNKLFSSGHTTVPETNSMDWSKIKIANWTILSQFKK